MRASRWLRHRAQANRTRYAMRALVTEVLPSLVDSMQTMNDTLRIQSCIMGNHLKTHEPADPVRCPKCGGPHPFHDPACEVHPDLIQDHNEQE